jgi:hypothetical protein
MVGSCDHDNEPSSSIKSWEFLDQLCNCQLHKKDLRCVASLYICSLPPVMQSLTTTVHVLSTFLSNQK